MKDYAYIYVLVFFSIFILVEIISVVRILSQSLPTFKRIRITLKINLIVFLTGFLMLAVATLFEVNYLQYELPIPYSGLKQITFKDFTGLKRPKETLDGMSEFAFIVTETRIKTSGNTVEVSCYFHPARSYVFNSNIDDNKLLQHELYHFHIREYNARLLRKKIALLGSRINEMELEKMKNEMEFEEGIMQYQYDDETYHSYVRGKQIAWEQKIDSCLLSLKDYESVFVKIK